MSNIKPWKHAEGTRINKPLTTNANKWNSIHHAVESGTATTAAQLLRMFKSLSKDVAYRIGYAINAGMWRIADVAPNTPTGQRTKHGPHNDELGKLVLSSYADSEIAVVKRFARKSTLMEPSESAELPKISAAIPRPTVPTRRRKPMDGNPSNKHGVFALFLADPESFDVNEAHAKYPAVDLETIVNWESRWRNWNKSTFTGTDGFPRGMADSPQKIARIKDAILRARDARGTGRRGRIDRKLINPEANFAGELSDDRKYVEGAVSRVLVNRFERDRKARSACLNEKGYACTVCQVDFYESYGELGRGFIHVHHLRPLALRRTEYLLDPKEDLVPVCPNCHAMLHTSDPPLNVDKLRKIWRERNNA